VYSIEEGSISEHKPILLDLLQRNFPWLAEGRFSWIYENNPGGPPTILLLKHEKSGTYVGMLAMFPRQIFIHGESYNAYICGDMVVDAQHRTLGPATLLFKSAINQCKKDPFSILLSFPIYKSEKVALRSGFMVMGERYECTKIIRSQKYLQQYISSKFVVCCIASLLDASFHLLDKAFQLSRLKKYRWQVSDYFEEYTDEFWQNLPENFELIGARNPGYLNWRFKESPYCRNKFFSLFENDTFIGYIAFTLTNSRCQIVDLAYSGHSQHLRILLCLFTQYHHSIGSDALTMTICGHELFSKTIKRSGFSVRNKENKVIYYSIREKLDLVGSHKKHVWYLTDADNDI
jgi:GNAT superfamily N-acetyltransferase